MYTAMAKPIKEGRINIRIAKDLKDAAEVLAEMDHKDLTEFITSFVSDELKAALKNNKAAYDDAAERLARDAALKATNALPPSPCISCGNLAKGGLCQACRDDLIRSPKMAQEKLNELPYGAIQLNEEGTIIAYNKAETEMSRISHKKAIGQNFFTLAPCADIQDFHGRYSDFLQGNTPSITFPFSYSFKHGAVDVTIAFTRLNSRLALVTARKIVKAAQRKRA